MQLRQYQREAVNAIYDYFTERDGHPLIVMPTASGKSFVMAAFIKETLEHWSDQRILVLTHVRELIRQNFQELVDHWPLAPAGVYSAGLKRRESNAQVLFGGIQSVHNKADEIGTCDLILIDECHLVPRTSDTMYRRFLDEMSVINDQVKVVGLTATHYRLDSGLLTEGKDRVFTDVAYEVPVRRLIDEGWLSPLVTKAPTTELDTTGVHTRGGEFISGELATAVDKIEINAAAVREIVHYGRDRQSWLIFCVGVSHAYHIRDVLREHGVAVETVTGETNKLERDYILEEFKAGRLRAVTNCDLLTTGFNHPGIDMLAILRPTQSTGLYVQIAGRGMRNAPGKENCIAEGELVLTDQGLVPIERVTRKMRLWDGLNWVYHNGIVNQGLQEVITYAGLTATPDHLVWTKEGWTQFGECALKQTPIAQTGVGRQAIRAAHCLFRRDIQKDKDSKATTTDKMLLMRRGEAARLYQRDKEYSRVSAMQSSEASPKMARKTRYRCAAEMLQPKKQVIQKLWRARHKIRIRFATCYGAVGSREPRSSQRYGVRPNRQRRSLCARKFALLDTASKYVSYTAEAPRYGASLISGEISKGKICGQHASRHAWQRDEIRRNRKTMESSIQQTKRQVWDILNAGPLHRFTVSGLLVSNCLVLDFAGNIERHGPIDMVQPYQRSGNGNGRAPVKRCPRCQSVIYAGYSVCPDCGYEFPPPEVKINPEASTERIISDDKPFWVEVDRICYRRHEKTGKPDSLRVDYHSGLLIYPEWVCLEHDGFAQRKARNWWVHRGGDPTVRTISQALSSAEDLKAPTRIRVRADGNYWRIVDYHFNQYESPPVEVEEDWTDEEYAPVEDEEAPF